MEFNTEAEREGGGILEIGEERDISNPGEPPQTSGPPPLQSSTDRKRWPEVRNQERDCRMSGHISPLPSSYLK